MRTKTTLQRKFQEALQTSQNYHPRKLKKVFLGVSLLFPYGQFLGGKCSVLPRFGGGIGIHLQ